jgi:hypothetical protein
MSPAASGGPLRRSLAAAVGGSGRSPGDDAYEVFDPPRARSGPSLSCRALYEQREERKWSGCC